MKEYEIVCEIFNQCANNQMRDVFFSEEQVADPADYVRKKEVGAELDVISNEDGTIFVNTECQGLRKRYTFTPID